MKEPKRKGRPKWKPEEDKYTERYTVLVTPAMKAWIAENGGGAYLRRLADADRQTREIQGDGK